MRTKDRATRHLAWRFKREHPVTESTLVRGRWGYRKSHWGDGNAWVRYEETFEFDSYEAAVYARHEAAMAHASTVLGEPGLARFAPAEVAVRGLLPTRRLPGTGGARVNRRRGTVMSGGAR